eukprot:COSAG06_NODE_26091_length_622_cov_0.592734_1_plen_103_part_01
MRWKYLKQIQPHNSHATNFSYQCRPEVFLLTHHDAHSLRIHNPTDGEGLQLQFFPAKTLALPYTLSVWTKAETLQTGGALELRLGFGLVGGTNISWTNGAPDL